MSQDWANFVMYFALYGAYNQFLKADAFFECPLICQTVGYHDPWQVFSASSTMKDFVATITTVQWLKVIKYVNGVVPKFALATSVLSHGLADLLMFFLFFVWSIVSFAQMFTLQLGSYMDGYSNLLLSSVTLFRALFGDFDIEAVLNTSNSWVNVAFFIGYLFSAVFILLSIFLTILGEHQGYVREQEDAERAARSPGAVGEWGVLEYIGRFFKKHGRAALALGKKSESPPEEVEDGKQEAPTTATRASMWGAAKATMWTEKATLEKMDRMVLDLEQQVKALETSGDDAEKLGEMQKKLTEVKQMQAARLVAKANELKAKATEPGTLRRAPSIADVTCQLTSPPGRARGIFGSMPKHDPLDDTAENVLNLAREVASIKEMLQTQESLLRQLLRDNKGRHSPGLEVSSPDGEPVDIEQVCTGLRVQARQRERHRRSSSGTGEGRSRSEGRSPSRRSHDEGRSQASSVAPSSVAPSSRGSLNAGSSSGRTSPKHRHHESSDKRFGSRNHAGASSQC